MPRRVIPIVFLPGIMGSHLRLSQSRQQELKKGTDIAWRPEATAEAIAMMFKGPKARQMILDPEATDVDRYDPAAASADQRHRNVRKVAFVSAPTDEEQAGLNPQQRDDLARRRGWSEVFFESYGLLLKTLEAQLNRMCRLGEVQPAWIRGPHQVAGVDPGSWGAAAGAACDEARLRTISDAWYPVHAMGYNWLRSNGESAKTVAAQIRSLIADYNAAKFRCEKVIVVTHSMGGLVGRALVHPDYGNAQDVVAGIIHGAMPAVGAAAAYKRMRAGFEGGGLMGYMLKKVVGENGPEVTAVLANAPGGLQLLPSERYGAGWLKVRLDGTDRLSLPQADPYAEIYTVEDKWYRLIEKEWVNPADQEEATLWRAKLALLNARDFHRAIADHYHPTTYLSYGADDKQKAWGDVVWEIGKAPFFGGGAGQRLGLEKLDIATDPEQWLARHDNGTGAKVLTDGTHDQLFSARIGPPNEAGDSTVPGRSAEDPVKQGKPKIAFRQTGYEHQASFQDPAVIASTLYAIAYIAAEEFHWWDA